MVKYTIHYFNLRGRAELARLICVAGGLDWEDKRYTKEDWAEFKGKVPLGQLPILTFDDQKLCQSVAITRFLARTANLTGDTEVDKAHSDALVDTVKDTFDNLLKMRFAKDDTVKAEANKAFRETLTRALDHLTKHLEGKQFLIGGKLSWADLALLNAWENWERTAADLIEKYPVVKALRDRVADVPSIKKYLAERPKSDF